MTPRCRHRPRCFLPIILVLLLFGVLIVMTGGSAIAPFIYAVF
ncbi:MAG: DUF5989 family protein [Desulfuromonadales bacterium]